MTFLFFCMTSLEWSCYLRFVLGCFGSVAGLYINIGKRELYEVGVVEDVEDLVGQTFALDIYEFCW